MIKTKTIYTSPAGGSIVCFSKNNRRIFQACSSSVCRYLPDLHSAKKHLKIIESNLILQPGKNPIAPLQRKTTLKWNDDGELSALDKARILIILTEKELTQCELDSDAA